MTCRYLKHKIVGHKRTATPRYGLTADGYTCKAGAPTSHMIRLEGEKRWRRLMCWCFSNCGTLFVRVAGEPLIVDEFDIPLDTQELAGIDRGQFLAILSPENDK